VLWEWLGTISFIMGRIYGWNVSFLEDEIEKNMFSTNFGRFWSQIGGYTGP
jgi:hypothetical protein